MRTAIKAICFDLDGVYFTPQGKQSFHNALSEEFGADPAVVDEIMYRSDVMRNFVTGKIESHDLWEHIRNETGITANDEELVARWIRDYEIDQGVQKAVLSAKEFIFFHSDNDPYCPLDHAEFLANELDGKLIVMPGEAHFSISTAGEKYKEFPELLEKIV